MVCFGALWCAVTRFEAILSIMERCGPLRYVVVRRDAMWNDSKH